MAVLRLTLALLFNLAVWPGVRVHAALSQDGEVEDPRDKLIAEQAKQLCRSTDEYVRTLNFLRQTKEIILPEKSARQIAERVSRGCDGASERFSKILLLMKSSGLSDPKSLEIALEFAGYPAEVQRAFTEVFTRAFLGEFFDYEYSTAVKLAYELSRDFKGDPAHLREDFIYLAQLCKDGKSLDMPVRTCAEYAVKVARLSQYFPEGIRAPFTGLYKKLREDRDFSMPVKSALDISYNVLKHGPLAAENFFSAYAYALKEDGLALGRDEALDFALRMAARSHQGKKIPHIPSAAAVANVSGG